MSQDYFLDRTQGAGAIAAHAPAPRSAPAPMLRGRRALGAINMGGPGRDEGSGASGGGGTRPRTFATAAMLPSRRPRGLPALPAPKPPRLAAIQSLPMAPLPPVKAQPGRPAITSTSTSVTPGSVAPQPGRPASGGGGGGGGGFFDEIDEETPAKPPAAAPPPAKKLPWWVWAGAAAGGVVLYRTVTKRKR